jgi:hypothetical protein
MTWADTKVWACAGCGAQLTSADLHGTSAESVMDHDDGCPEMAKVRGAERARIETALKSEAQRLVGMSLTDAAALLRSIANALGESP